MVKSWHFLQKRNSKKFLLKNSLISFSLSWSTFPSFRKQKPLKRWKSWSEKPGARNSPESLPELKSPSNSGWNSSSPGRFVVRSKVNPCCVTSPAQTPQGCPGTSLPSRLPAPGAQPGKETVPSPVAYACKSGPRKGGASWLKEICLAGLIWKCKLMMSQQSARTAGRVILETSWHFGGKWSKP